MRMRFAVNIDILGLWKFYMVKLGACFAQLIGCIIGLFRAFILPLLYAGKIKRSLIYGLELLGPWLMAAQTKTQAGANQPGLTVFVRSAPKGLKEPLTAGVILTQCMTAGCTLTVSQ